MHVQTLFGKEADSLEQATDVPGTCILNGLFYLVYTTLTASFIRLFTRRGTISKHLYFSP